MLPWKSTVGAPWSHRVAVLRDPGDESVFFSVPLERPCRTELTPQGGFIIFWDSGICYLIFWDSDFSH